MGSLKKYIRRYTSIAAVIDTLRRKEMALLDPQNWDDRNDRYFMNLYKEYRRINGLYGLCACMATETYHHWRVFAGRDGGACIELQRAPLEKALASTAGFRFGEVEYLLLKQMRQLGRADADRLPFTKRRGFSDEKEYRVIAERDEPQQSSYAIGIKLGWINQITINPWLPEPISQSVVAILKALPGCGDLPIRKSRLIDSSSWKREGDRIAGKPTATTRKSVT